MAAPNFLPYSQRIEKLWSRRSEFAIGGFAVTFNNLFSMSRALDCKNTRRWRTVSTLHEWNSQSMVVENSRTPTELFSASFSSVSSSVQYTTTTWELLPNRDDKANPGGATFQQNTDNKRLGAAAVKGSVLKTGEGETQTSLKKNLRVRFTLPEESSMAGSSGKKNFAGNAVPARMGGVPSMGNGPMEHGDQMNAYFLAAGNRSLYADEVAMDTTLDLEDQISFKKTIMSVWNRMLAHRSSIMFLKRHETNVSKKVMRNMDLATLKRNIKSGFVVCIEAFERYFHKIIEGEMKTARTSQAETFLFETQQEIQTMVEIYKSTKKAESDEDSEDEHSENLNMWNEILYDSDSDPDDYNDANGGQERVITSRG